MDNPDHNRLVLLLAIADQVQAAAEDVLSRHSIEALSDVAMDLLGGVTTFRDKVERGIEKLDKFGAQNNL
jgi:hypothetical protein